MDTANRHTQEKREGQFGRMFTAGMEQFSLRQRTQTERLCALGAAAGCGILCGIFLFYLCGEHADTEKVRQTYFEVRAFSSYATLRQYCTFFAAWFVHHAGWLLAAAFSAGLYRPQIPLCLLCFCRGAAAGGSLCTVGQAFSLFAVFHAAVQSAMLCLLLMLSAKSICYAKARNEEQKAMKSPADGFSPRRIFGSLLPFLCGCLLCLSALLAGLLLLSCIAELSLRF